MRKLLLTLVAFVTLSTAANAQSTVKFNAIKAESGVIQKRQGAVAAEPKTIKKTRSKVALGENQRIMANYNSDSYASSMEGIGLPKYAGNLRVAAIIPCEAGCKFDGSTVKSIRFALANATEVTRVFMIKLNATGSFGDEVVSQAVENSVVGWNTIELATPYTINAEGLAGFLVGFDYVQSNANDGTYYNDECYPISVVDEGRTTMPSYIYGNLGDGEGWYNIGLESYGNLSVQCIVEKEGGFLADDLSVELYTAPFGKKGDKTMVYALVYNEGTQTPSSYTLGLALDGNEVEEINTPSPLQEVIDLEGTIDIPADAATGEHTISLYVKTINGKVPTEAINDDQASATFNVYSESLPRQKQLIEHFTSQYCTHCPKGIAVLEGLVKERDDIAWVSLHQNMSSKDEYTISKGQSISNALNAISLPGIVINRTCPLGSEDLEIGIGYPAAYKQQAIDYLNSIIDYTNYIPALASINIATAYNEETKKLDITVSGNVLDEFTEFVGTDAALTVFLTEDGLVSRQLNDGNWDMNFTHDNVLRSIPTNVYGDNLTITNGTYEKKYSVSISSSWNIDNMNVVASIGRKVKQANVYDKVWVSNAEKVKAFDRSNSINSAISNGAEATVVARYNANGVRLAAPVKGINIVKMSDGTTRKVVVE